jgi:hypothetical protein
VDVITADVKDPEIRAGARAESLLGGIHGQIVQGELLQGRVTRRVTRRGCGIGRR